MTQKEIALGDIFTDAELKRAAKLDSAKEICEQVTQPALARINEATGQENDPLYWAYAIQYALTRNGRNEI